MFGISRKDMIPPRTAALLSVAYAALPGPRKCTWPSIRPQTGASRLGHGIRRYDADHPLIRVRGAPMALRRGHAARRVDIGEGAAACSPNSYALWMKSFSQQHGDLFFRLLRLPLCFLRAKHQTSCLRNKPSLFTKRERWNWKIIDVVSI